MPHVEVNSTRSKEADDDRAFTLMKSQKSNFSGLHFSPDLSPPRMSKPRPLLVQRMKLFLANTHAFRLCSLFDAHQKQNRNRADGVVSKTMAHLCKVYSRAFSTSAALKTVIKNVTVIGGGLMGSGIAQVNLVSSTCTSFFKKQRKQCKFACKQLDLGLDFVLH